MGVTVTAAAAVHAARHNQGAADPVVPYNIGADAILVPTGTKTSAYSAAANDLVMCDASAAGFTVTFPTAPADQTRIAVKKVDTNAENAVTIAAGGSDKFELAASTETITHPRRVIVYQYNAFAGVWESVSTYLSVSTLNIPASLSDLSGSVTTNQLPAGAVLAITFTSSNNGTLARPTSRTDVTVIWKGDATTSSSTMPVNRITGDMVFVGQS